MHAWDRARAAARHPNAWSLMILEPSPTLGMVEAGQGSNESARHAEPGKFVDLCGSHPQPIG